MNNVIKKTVQTAPLLLSCLGLLAGCDGNTNTVKDQVYPEIDSSMPLGKALKTRTDCEAGEWDSYSDDRGRDVVSYTCTLPQLYLDTFKNKALAQSSTPENEKNKLDQKIAEFENKKNDVPHLKDYLLANYVKLITLNAVDKDTLKQAADDLFSSSATINASGVLTPPSRETADTECQSARLPSCDEYYTTQLTLTGLFNGLTKALGYSGTHTTFILPAPDAEISDVSIFSSDRSNEVLSDFYQLLRSLIDIQRPFLSADTIARDYTALIPKIDAKIDTYIATQNEHYSKWLSGYNVTVGNATFTSVKESFYWYIDDNSNPVDSGGTLTFSRNGKSETVRMRDRDSYLAVAYQSFPSDRIPTIYLDAMGFYYYNAWMINSRGGI